MQLFFSLNSSKLCKKVKVRMKGMTVSMTESADDHDGCEGGAWARLTVEVEMSMRVSGLESNHFCNCDRNKQQHPWGPSRNTKGTYYHECLLQSNIQHLKTAVQGLVAQQLIAEDPGFHSYHPQSDSQPYETPILGDTMPSSGSKTTTWSIHSFKRKITNNFFYLFNYVSSVYKQSNF